MRCSDARVADRGRHGTAPTDGPFLVEERVIGPVEAEREKPWGKDGTFHLPCFVLTHRAAPTLVKGKTSFTFVTEGPERALALAQAAAGDKAVNVMGADTIQQLLRRGLIDEIHLNLVPVLLQAGTRLFEHLGPDRIELERTRAILPSSGVIHLTYRIPRRR